MDVFLRSTNLLFPVSLPFLRPLCSLKHNPIKSRPTSIPAVASECSYKRKSYLFLTLNQKLEMIAFSAEGI